MKLANKPDSQLLINEKTLDSEVLLHALLRLFFLNENEINKNISGYFFQSKVGDYVGVE